MNPSELGEVVDYCEDRWPGTRNFRAWDKAAGDFASVPAAGIWEAAHNHFNAGERTAPTLSQLKAQGAMLAASQGMGDPDDNHCDIRGHHSRNWAIADIEATEGSDRLREAQCLDCGTIIIKPAHQIATVGEAAARLKEGGSSVPDHIADRIAP